MPTKQNILYSDQIIRDSIMMNIQYKLTVSNFSKLDEIIMKQVQNSLMNFCHGKII